ncbi:hypothetical protein MRX96_000198 [Rhipicephalus microplus]
MIPPQENPPKREHLWRLSAQCTQAECEPASASTSYTQFYAHMEGFAWIGDRALYSLALWNVAGLTTNDREKIIFRLPPLQNLAIISTPQSHVADALYWVRVLRLGERVYPITAYFAGQLLQGYCSWHLSR